VIAYVDGFNLYFGMKSRGWKRLYWLNLERLAASFLRSDQDLVAVKYFTARISGPPDKKSRQDAYLEALRTVPGLSIYEGHYRLRETRCEHCRKAFSVPNEKMTDVNIASELLVDAFHDSFTTAFIVSGDSDLVPPIRHVRNTFPTKSVVALFPPDRASKDLASVAHARIDIGEAKLRHAQFPNVIQRPGSVPLARPPRWS
jgi:uncharacterized LabA/DUF88 family protein